MDAYFQKGISCHSNQTTLVYFLSRFHYFFHQGRFHLHGVTCLGNFHHEQNLQEQAVNFVLRRSGLLKNGVD